MKIRTLIDNKRWSGSALEIVRQLAEISFYKDKEDLDKYMQCVKERVAFEVKLDTTGDNLETRCKNFVVSLILNGLAAEEV